MLDDEDGHALRGELAHDLGHLLDDHRGEPVRGLVEQQHPGAEQQRTAGHDVLVVTTTPGDPLPGVLRVASRSTGASR